MKKNSKTPLIVFFICMIIIYYCVFRINRTIRFIPLYYLVLFLTLDIWWFFYLLYVFKKDKISIKQLLKSKSKKNNKRKIVYIIVIIFIIIGSIKVIRATLDLVIGPQELVLNSVELRKKSSRFSITGYYVYGVDQNGKKAYISITASIFNANGNNEYIRNNKTIKVKYYKYIKYIYEIEK